jgi:hypothetical protein
MKTVEITIAADGTSTVEAQNFHGQGCAEATLMLELALAGPAGADSDDKKPEFWQTHGNAIGNSI